MAMLRRGGKSSRKPKKPTRRDAYRGVAARVDGEFHEGKRAGKDRVLVRRGPWRIWLDTYTVSTGQVTITYTRVRAYFRGRRDLRVTVRRRTWFDRLFARFGFGTLLRVDPRLNDRYVVKGSPERRVPSLFSAPGVTEAILALPSLRLEVKRPSRKGRRRFGEDAGVVVSQTTGVITDVERLAGMIQVVGETLEGLERIGEASQEELPDS